MQTKILGALAVALLFCSCGVETAVTAGAVGGLEATAASEALKQKEMLMKQVEESAQAMERHHSAIKEATQLNTRAIEE